MSQSGFIAGMLLAAFVLWLVINDRLGVYTNVLWGPTAAPKPTGAPIFGVYNAPDPNAKAPKKSTGGSGGGGLLGFLPGWLGGGGGADVGNGLSIGDLLDSVTKAAAPVAVEAAMVAG